MARSFSQSLLAAAVALVVGGTSLAQSTPLQDAVTLLRLSKKEDATTKLREILAADPSNADALAMYRSITQDEWFLLVTHQEGGQASEIQKMSQSLLERAKVETKQRSRDEAAIKLLVDAATAGDSDFPSRQKAINKLICDHGEFAAPALVEKLGDKDNSEGQELAISALSQLRSAAVLPLLEALKSGNELTVQNAAAALHLIGDDRAIPSMAHLAGNERAGTREIAKRFMAKKGASGSAVDLLLAQSKQYLGGNVAVGSLSDVVWSLKGDKLVATDVPAMLYPSELAKVCASEAVRLAPASVEARGALAQASIEQAKAIEGAIAKGDTSAKALEAVAAELRITALASGDATARQAVEATYGGGMVKIAVPAIAETQIDQAALQGVLKSTNKEVRYAAAAGLVKASGGKAQSEEIVGILAEAVAEESIHMIQVIAPTADTRAAVESTSKVRGFAVEASVDAISGMRKLLVNPGVDVVVINEILPDRAPEDIIGNIKKNPRMAGAKVIVVAKDEEAAKTRFGEGIAIIKAPLTGENLVAAVNTALQGVSDAGNERAEAFAVKASTALLTIAASGGSISSAVGNLSKQLNRADNVAVPSAQALGFAGGAAELGALTTVLAGAGSVDLKSAAAIACGGILGRMGECSDGVYTALVGALDGATDIGLRTAIGTALSKATLSAEKRAELLKKLSRIASAPVAGS